MRVTFQDKRSGIKKYPRLNCQRRRWLFRKYYASVMNLKEFLKENIGAEFCGTLSDFARNSNKQS
jgi:hypothetical protein